MASLFRARPLPEETGSGGKILRDRGASKTSRPSPYARPPPPPPLPPPSPPPSRSPRWLLGLVSGAGKFICSVFRSDSSSAASSAFSGYSSGEESSPRSDEEENVDAPKALHGFNQGIKKPLGINDHMEVSHAIVPISETKLAIEKLLSQETFSRDECDRLTKLIQSRVVDSPQKFVQDGAGKGATSSVPAAAIDYSRAWQSLKQTTDPRALSTLSPRTPASRACMPDVDSIAVMEAKKWLEEKKLSSNSKVDPTCGPYTLNSDMSHYHKQTCIDTDLHVEDVHDAISPVDLAKSYMKRLPPWQSPSLSSNNLISSMPKRLYLSVDGSNRETASHSLPSFKEFKRKYLSARLRESPDASRNVHLKSVDEVFENHALKQFEARQLFQNETLKISSADERDQDALRTMHHSRSLPSVETSQVPTTMSAGLEVTDPSLPDKSVKANASILSDKSTSIIITSELVKTVSTNETALPTISSLYPNESKIQVEPMSPIEFDANRNEPIPNDKEDIIDGNVPNDSFISASTSMVQEGDLVSMIENAVVAPEGMKFMELRDATNVDNIAQTSSANATSVVGILKADTSPQLNLDSDAMPREMKIDPHHGEDGPAIVFSTNSRSTETNAISQSVRVEDHSSTQCSAQTTAIAEETCQHPNEADDDPSAAHQLDYIKVKSENGTKMKSIERVLVEPQPSYKSRRKTAVAKVRRGRGKGRGTK